MKPALVSHEIEVLEMIEGKRPWESGAWVNACLEVLRGGDYITEYIGAYPTLTPTGRSILDGGRDGV
jgi:hypothetical protein